MLDRGDQEIQIFYFLERLQKEAEHAGGKLYVLNGNHGGCRAAGGWGGCAKDAATWMTGGGEVPVGGVPIGVPLCQCLLSVCRPEYLIPWVLL